MPNHFLNYPRRPILFLIATFSVSATASEIDATAEIRRCAAIGDGAERVACYEELGRQVTAEPAAESTSTAGVAAASPAAVDAASARASVEAPVAAESTSATTAAPETEALPDDLGGEKFSEKEAREEQE